MDSAPLLHAIARALFACKLEAILIGNAAAALHGAPVTTLDFDFMFRKTSANLKKLRRFADEFEAAVLKPFYPASDLFRVVNEDRGLQADFMGAIDGIRSFASLRSRAEVVNFGVYPLWVASLKDVVTSKKAAHRARDLAALPILEKTLHEKEKLPPPKINGA